MQDVVVKLDKLVQWGYKARRIDGKLLEGFQEVIRELSAAEQPADNGHEMLSQFTGRIGSLTRVIGLTGFTAKGIAQIEALDDDFLAWFERCGFNIQCELDFHAFVSIARWKELLCDIDLRNVAFYRRLFGWAATGNPDRYLPYLQFMRSLCPHLNRYFDQVETGRDLDDVVMNSELYSYHLQN